MSIVRPQGSVAFDNTGRVVLVSGGANGIGRAICEAFLSSGAAVVCLDVDAPSGATLPGGVEFIHGDTSCEADCAGAVAATIRQHGALDVLVNNAAIQPRDSYVRVDELSAELWQRMLDVNLSGYTFMAKYALRQMREQGSGVVVNLASGQAHRTARYVPAYGPMKAANRLQAMQWGGEYARDGIRVVSVSPDFTSPASAL